SEFGLLWNNECNQVIEPENHPIHFEQEQLHPEVPTAQSKLQTIPYELMLFDQKKRKGQKVECLDKKRNKEERTLRFWQETRRMLEEK
ncbi:hypothetical protein, partial [Acinetobacter baumannii]